MAFYQSHQQDALPGHPAYRQHGSALDTIVIPAVQVPAHAEVSNLDGVVLAHKAVAGGQIAMYEIERGEIFHP